MTSDLSYEKEIGSVGGNSQVGKKCQPQAPDPNRIRPVEIIKRTDEDFKSPYVCVLSF